MKKTLKIITSLILCISLLMIPMQVMAAPETKTKPLYISEVKIGMGETEMEAARELLENGYTILCDEDGDYSDLNYRTGTDSGMKKGPTEKIVYLGYKTTDDPKDAITDLAVMNMNGGYSVQDYELLMEQHLEGEIKPFVDRFVSSLNEYRENYNKPADSLGHIKADCYRKMLNKLTDDDTGGKHLGDLLLKETKYEMGDEAYNALSDKEKNEHADILTMLMQGNGRAVLLLETLIAKSTDSSEDTWVDRFLEKDLESMKKNIKQENPNITSRMDVLKELDKRYYDSARKILEKWDSFYEVILNYDDSVNEIANAEESNVEELVEKAKNIDTDNPTPEDIKTVKEIMKERTQAVGEATKLEGIGVVEFLEETEYEDGTLLDFFNCDKSNFQGESIRELYPMVASLSDGQIAALDFLSITDLFTMAIANEEGYNSINIDDLEEASVFQDVDRAIYEPGGVALTNAALRSGASAKDDDSDFLLSTLGFLYWGISAVSWGLAATNVALNHVYASKFDALNEIHAEDCIREDIYADITANEVDETAEQLASYSTKSDVTRYLAMGFTVVAVLISAWSIYTTITEMLDYYKVTFTPIPKYMVEETDITEEVNGKKIVINNQTAYYKVVPCNRKEGKSDVEKENFKVLGTSNDLNGDVGKQWLALYSVKYEYGRPILADSLKVVKGSKALPSGYETGIHRFGEGAAFNLTSEFYCYNDKPKGTYVYFKNDAKSVKTMTTSTGTATTADKKTGENTTGSFFSAGSLALGVGVGLLLGAGIAVLILLPMMKKKKVSEA